MAKGDSTQHLLDLLEQANRFYGIYSQKQLAETQMISNQNAMEYKTNKAIEIADKKDTLKFQEKILLNEYSKNEREIEKISNDLAALNNTFDDHTYLIENKHGTEEGKAMLKDMGITSVEDFDVRYQLAGNTAETLANVNNAISVQDDYIDLLKDNINLINDDSQRILNGMIDVTSTPEEIAAIGGDMSDIVDKSDFLKEVNVRSPYISDPAHEFYNPEGFDIMAHKPEDWDDTKAWATVDEIGRVDKLSDEARNLYEKNVLYSPFEDENQLFRRKAILGDIFTEGGKIIPKALFDRARVQEQYHLQNYVDQQKLIAAEQAKPWHLQKVNREIIKGYDGLIANIQTAEDADDKHAEKTKTAIGTIGKALEGWDLSPGNSSQVQKMVDMQIVEMVIEYGDDRSFRNLKIRDVFKSADGTGHTPFSNWVWTDVGKSTTRNAYYNAETLGDLYDLMTEEKDMDAKKYRFWSKIWNDAIVGHPLSSSFGGTGGQMIFTEDNEVIDVLSQMNFHGRGTDQNSSETMLASYLQFSEHLDQNMYPYKQDGDWLDVYGYKYPINAEGSFQRRKYKIGEQEFFPYEVGIIGINEDGSDFAQAGFDTKENWSVDLNIPAKYIEYDEKLEKWVLKKSAFGKAINDAG